MLVLLVPGVHMGASGGAAPGASESPLKQQQGAGA